MKDIPTIYVITRGNEFKIDDLKTLDENNFNSSKSIKVLSELASRINETIENATVNYNDFIVIDNYYAYNIDALLSKIKELSDLSNHQSIIKLNGHKLDFFIRTLKNIKGYFLNMINEKFSTIEDFVLKAQNNIDEYDKKTVISSDKMINNWKNVDDKIKQTIDGSIVQNNTVQSMLNTSSEFKNILTIQTWYQKNSDTIQFSLRRITEDIKLKLTNKLYDEKEKLKNTLYNSVDENDKVYKESLYLTIKNSIQENNIIHVNLPIDYILLYEQYYNSTFEYFEKDRYDSLKRNWNSIQSRIRSKNPIENVQKYIEEAKTTLSEIFETYNVAVSIYTVAAFSNEAKNYIRKLGLSEKLDLLDVEHPDINLYLNNAENEIFKKYLSAVKAFESGCSVIEESLK